MTISKKLETKYLDGDINYEPYYRGIEITLKDNNMTESKANINFNYFEKLLRTSNQVDFYILDGSFYIEEYKAEITFVVLEDDLIFFNEIYKQFKKDCK